jgi:hypothetical protein
MVGCYAVPYLNNARPGTRLAPLTSEYQQVTITFPTTFFKQATYTFTVVISCGKGLSGGTVTFDDVTMTQVIQ